MACEGKVYICKYCARDSGSAITVCVSVEFGFGCAWMIRLETIAWFGGVGYNNRRRFDYLRPSKNPREYKVPNDDEKDKFQCPFKF